MTVRRRTLEHLARALTVTSVVSTACGCDPVPHPIVQTDPTTPPRGVPDDPPPVVCDPMPAPYCPPNAASPEELAKVSPSAAWEGHHLTLNLTYFGEADYTVVGTPTVAHAGLVESRPGSHDTTAVLAPESPNRTIRVTWQLSCQGQIGTVVVDVTPGAPGGEPKVERVK